MAQLTYTYDGVSKECEPFYRDEGFDGFMSVVKKYFGDNKLTKFTRVLHKNKEELRLEFDNDSSATAFEVEMTNWFKDDDKNNETKNIKRIKG